MPRITDLSLLHEATRYAVGNMSYDGSVDRAKWEKARDMAGITKGQWKRFQFSMKTNCGSESVTLKVSEVSIKKLEVMRMHPKSPHLMTLLKMVEAQMEKDHEL